MAVRLSLFLFNRATYARMKAFIGHTQAHPGVDLTLVLSSSLLSPTYGKAVDYIEKFHPKANIVKIPTDDFPYTHADMAEGQVQIASRISDYLKKTKIDIAMLVADRYETDPASMVLASFHVPTIHVQGGEITGNIDEKIRHAITKRSDYHFAATTLAAKYLVQMGEDEERVFHVGCPSIDLISMNKIARNIPGKTMMCIFHPETDRIDHAFEQTRIVMEATVKFCASHHLACEWFYPNPDPGRQKITDYLDQNLKTHPKLLSRAINREPEAFLRKLASAPIVIGNSSCLIRESAYLGVPAVLIGDRQAIRERGWNVIEVDYQSKNIFEAMAHQKQIGHYMRNMKLFGCGKARAAMLDIILDIHRSSGFTIKGPLTYPAWKQFRGEHFGQSTSSNITSARIDETSQAVCAAG